MLRAEAIFTAASVRSIIQTKDPAKNHARVIK